MPDASSGNNVLGTINVLGTTAVEGSVQARHQQHGDIPHAEQDVNMSVCSVGRSKRVLAHGAGRLDEALRVGSCMRHVGIRMGTKPGN